MSDEAKKPIWNPETGIVGLDADWAGLAASEVPGVRAVWAGMRERLEGTAQLREFTEQLSREWAIETGVIENLYDIERGVTQTLIERGFQAELLGHGATNKPRDYVMRLLRDQREALEGVFDFVKNERRMSVSYIKELHAMLLRSQNTIDAIDSHGRNIEVNVIKGDWKKLPNHPERDGIVYTYCPPEQVGSEMDRLLAMHLEHIERGAPPDVAAAWLHHRFTQIHPFQDGNGRVARALASMSLIKNGLFPLVVTRDDKPQYLAALEQADEGDLKPLIALIAKLQNTQFRKASAISVSVLTDDSIGLDAALESLHKAAGKAAARRGEDIKAAFNLAKALEQDVGSRLEEISSSIEKSLKQIAESGAEVRVEQADADSASYYRQQITENAKRHFRYFADTSEYRSWVALSMRWNSGRSAKLVFAFHGIGRPFNGSLICAPFLEFKDSDKENEPRATLLPITEEAFIFFYNEEKQTLLPRFHPWRDSALKTALKELEGNLW